MSKRLILKKIFASVMIALSTILLVINITAGVMLVLGGDGTIHFGKIRVTAVDTSAGSFMRGDLIGVMSGSIPENTPVAVQLDGVTVLQSSQLAKAETPISREQILGGVGWSVPLAGWLVVWVRTMPGMIAGVFIPAAVILWMVIVLIRNRAGGPPEGFPLPAKETRDTSADSLLAELDYKLAPKTSEVSPTVKTVLISQTRPASSGIRSQKGEVRVYAAGQERVLPLNIGRRSVSIGGYLITVDIAREDMRTEDVTRELPVMRRDARPEMSDTQKIEVVKIE